MKRNHQQLFGQVRKTSSLAGFNFTETIYPEKLRLPFHSHDFSYFCFVLGGEFTENIGKKEHLCQTSTAVFHPSGETHSDYFHTSSRCFNVQINPYLLKHFYSGSAPEIERTVVQNNSGINQLMARLYREFYHLDKFSALTIEGLILEIIAEFLRFTSKDSLRSVPEWLRIARDFISEEFTNDLTIPLIAAEVDVHPTHLAREFRRYFQMTIGDFIRRRRIEFACRELVRTNTPLSEISLESGFYDQSHFSRAFKTQTGMTPAEYRKTFSAAKAIPTR